MAAQSFTQQLNSLSLSRDVLPHASRYEQKASRDARRRIAYEVAPIMFATSYAQCYSLSVIGSRYLRSSNIPSRAPSRDGDAQQERHE
jgi:hypothetical protein